VFFLHYIAKILHAEVQDSLANYSCEKFCLMTYRLATIHPLRTTTEDDGRTDRRQPYVKLDRYLNTVG